MIHLLRDPEFWVLVAFVLFFVLFGGRLWAALTNILDSRARAISAELAEAQRLRTEAETMLRDAERARTEAIAEAERMLVRSREQALEVERSASAEAEASAKRRERMALERIAAAEKAAVTEVRQTAADIASAAARRVIEGGLGQDAEAAILDQAIANLPRALRAA